MNQIREGKGLFIVEAEMIGMLETAAIAVSGFLIKKYIFLEPDMEAGKQRIFYWISFFQIVGMFFAKGKDAATLAALFLIGINICLAREKHRIRGLLLMVPFPGIINGLLVPVLRVPPYLASLTAQGTLYYQLMVYGVLSVLLLLFYVKGRKWRRWFSENMQHRSLRTSEKWLLWLVGILMLVFSSEIARQLVEDAGKVQAEGGAYGQRLASFIGISSIAAFIMTLTIIVLIMQGNKRSFYHERVSSMQSGMITLMAEIVENRDDNTGGHIRRTAKYVEDIARALKRQGMYSDILTDRYLDNMVVAAPLHDIGKIHIPDSVLNK